MSGPQIVLWPVDDEYSFFPDLGEAVAQIGEPFHYKLCEERAPETPDAEGAIAEALSDVVNSIDGEAEARILTAPVVAELLVKLQDAIDAEAEQNKLWYPVGEVLKWAPDPEDGS